MSPAVQPVEELRGLSLEILLDILTSARPLHQALADARRREAATGAARRMELDALRRVDTRGYLLKRVKRTAAALEGLRDRLSRPALTMDALRWRLDGPVGPVALARKIVEEDADTAPFLVAEVALTVSRVPFHGVCRMLTPEAGAAERRRILGELGALARDLVAPTNLQAYVDAALREAVR